MPTQEEHSNIKQQGSYPFEAHYHAHADRCELYICAAGAPLRVRVTNVLYKTSTLKPQSSRADGHYMEMAYEAAYEAGANYILPHNESELYRYEIVVVIVGSLTMAIGLN